jgi:hypothetical protein
MNFSVFYRTILLVLTGSLLIFLMGCATPSNFAAMSVSRNEMNIAKNESKLFKENITLAKLSGGQKSTIVSKVDNEGFSKAIENSLSNVGFLSSDPSAAYQLTVALEELKQPLMGLDLKVVCKAKYTLYDNKHKRVVFEETLTTPYTAPFSSAFVAAERLRLANEGAVKENIKKFLMEINTL